MIWFMLTGYAVFVLALILYFLGASRSDKVKVVAHTIAIIGLLIAAIGSVYVYGLY